MNNLFKIIPNEIFLLVISNKIKNLKKEGPSRAATARSSSLIVGKVEKPTISHK